MFQITHRAGVICHSVMLSDNFHCCAFLNILLLAMIYFRKESDFTRKIISRLTLKAFVIVSKVTFARNFNPTTTTTFTRLFVLRFLLLNLI